jgi:hypothetical protein
MVEYLLKSMELHDGDRQKFAAAQAQNLDEQQQTL